MTCIGVITPVYYPSLVFLAWLKVENFGLEMYAYEHMRPKKMPVHTHTKACRGMHETAKRKHDSAVLRERQIYTRHLKRAKKSVGHTRILEFKVSIVHWVYTHLVTEPRWLDSKSRMITNYIIRP